MSAHLYLAPAASGKTTFAVKLAQQRSQELNGEVRVCVSSRLQATSWNRRLAEVGGALGVHVLTFDQLYSACLDEAEESYTRLSQPVQYRLLSNIINQVPLVHYASLKNKPGFIQIVLSFIEELKGARIFPQDFLTAVADLGFGPRLQELGLIYNVYQQYLNDHDWADYAGKGWLAVEALEMRAVDACRGWPLLIIDGFDDFTEIQLALINILAKRVGTLVVTMTGEVGSGEIRAVHRRFFKVIQRLEKLLTLSAEPLPGLTSRQTVFTFLEENLFSGQMMPAGNTHRLSLVETPDRATEVRAALRWLKQQLQPGGYKNDEVALIARNLESYRPFIVEVAAEFGLPVRLADGLPLRSNPAIVALLNLLKLVLAPRGQEDGFALPRSGVVAAWRSPYFEWSWSEITDEGEMVTSISAADADSLDQVARRGRVIGGFTQWEDAFTQLKAIEHEGNLQGNDRSPSDDLSSKFERFFKRIKPPQGFQQYRVFVAWLEDLIGSDLTPGETEEGDDGPETLNMVLRITQDERSTIDLAALRQLKDILRGLVWAQAAGNEKQLIEFSTFLTELTGAIDAAAYMPYEYPGHEAILAANVIRARGLPFKALALLGLAEGEFPAVINEDPLLRESDRQTLRERKALPLKSSIESAEQEFFYETVTGATEKLLITRPRLAESGAEWLASPFWEEINRLVPVDVQRLTTESIPSVWEACSLPELIESQVVHRPDQDARAWILASHQARWTSTQQAGRIFYQRYQKERSIFDGDLRQYNSLFSKHFSPEFSWSPSRLESYRNCAFVLFVSKALDLQPRQDPVEGLDVAQLGTVYHDILEAVYSSLDPTDRADTTRLLEILPEVAGLILDSAPEKHGFRELAWWQQTREEILKNIHRTIIEMAQLPGNFIPMAFEAYFGGRNRLTVFDGDDYFKLAGLIDRVDRDGSGRLRIIDYKTSGSYGFTKKSLEEGEKLQLPLYALAARDALGLGNPIEGFYWHIYQAKASELTLADFGPEEAMQTAVDYAWEAVRGARNGEFWPIPPGDGCPDWCPAAGFCWQYRARARR